MRIAHNSHTKIKKCLIFNFLDLPEHLQNEIKNKHSFRNDVWLEFSSEFEPSEITEEEIKKYWIDQVTTNNYKGDLEKFVSDYSLMFERWIIGLDLDLSDISHILIRICW